MTIVIILVSFCALCWGVASALVYFHADTVLKGPEKDMRREVYRAHAWSKGECI